MSAPKLPSEMHPNYPKAIQWTDLETRILTYKGPSFEEFKTFFDSHPEFKDEGEYVLVCPFCGDDNYHTEIMGWCCSEVGHCEWVLRTGDE